MVDESASDFQGRLAEALASVEAAITDLSNGDTATALDDVLAARLMLTTLQACPRQERSPK